VTALRLASRQSTPCRPRRTFAEPSDGAERLLSGKDPESWIYCQNHKQITALVYRRIGRRETQVLGTALNSKLAAHLSFVDGPCRSKGTTDNTVTRELANMLASTEQVEVDTAGPH
jgi:hypothetical protein